MLFMPIAPKDAIKVAAATAALRCVRSSVVLSVGSRLYDVGIAVWNLNDVAHVAGYVDDVEEIDSAFA